MFRNWIDPLEPIHLLQRFQRDPALRRKVLARLRLTRRGRVIAAWSQASSPPVHWLDIPLVRDRMNRMLTGDARVPYQKYVAQRYLDSDVRQRALSLGSGSGTKEMQWAETNRFALIEAFDISAARVRAAVASLQQTPFRDVIRYRVGDVHALPLPRASYDVVLFDHSLHHFSALDELLIRVREALKPGGIVVANEFIGPSRFQWTDLQVREVNRLLSSAPPELATLWESDFTRPKLRRPSKLLMWLSDPSEAVESSDIPSSLQRHFDVLEQKGYGGTILHPLFSGIAHHFINPDLEARQFLERAMAAEDALLEAREINHDFALIIGRKRG